VGGATAALRRVVSSELVPQWPEGLPAPAPAQLPATTRAGAAAVYFPACVNRIFGSDPGSSAPLARTGARRSPGARALSLPEALVAVSARAGLPLWIPDDVAGRCCATPWHSKGFRAGAEHMAGATRDALRRWSDGGALPVVVDASSCTQGLLEIDAEAEIVDSVAWAHDRLLPRLTISHRLRSVAVHPTCASRQAGLDGPLAALAAALADEVIVPAAATCCGFAGDRGLLHPELTEAATRDEAAELRTRPADAYVSSNRTCELGLRLATGAPYQSIIAVLETATR